jgi:methionyl-tRNA synthetase
MVNIKQTIENKEKIVVTSALPYANGKIHIGHLLEYIFTDIYTRFLKLVGKDCLYICASDMHGTPIMVNAKKAGLSPEEFTQKNAKEQLKDFKRFLIDFDNYYSTDSEENRELAELFFKTFKEKGYIYTKEIEQLYDEEAKQFLPDRFVKGTCPKCGAENQYGDVCESCSSILCPIDLLEPYSVLTKTKPVLKKTTHYYFKLSAFADEIKTMLNESGDLMQPEIRNFVQNWINEGLKDWCVSRDEPYFGFKIPGSIEETGHQKYFYVWLDAPIGYISSTWDYVKRNKGDCDDNNNDRLSWEDYWKSENSQVMHIIGKDIIYFHQLFWPIMLKVMGINLPIITVHGFITVDGKKMSKSRGTFFTAEEFHETYGAESLRFYYAKHLDRTVTDVNLNFEDFMATVNNVMVANLGNFCYRTLSFAIRNYADGLSVPALGKDENDLVSKFSKLKEEIENAYYDQEIKTAVKKILQICDLGNSYFQKLEPWRKRETEEEQQLVAKKVSFVVNLARNVTILVKPILPEFAKKMEKSFGLIEAIDGLKWSDISFEWHGKILSLEKLVQRIDKIPEIDTNEKDKLGPTDTTDTIDSKDSTNDPKFPLDIRAGKIVEIKDHPNAEKLYIFKVDFGDFQRQIIAGLKAFYNPGELLNKTGLFIINLKPAKLRGEMSEGMTLASDAKVAISSETEEKKEVVSLLFVPEDTSLGSQVKFDGFKTSSDIIGFDVFEKYQLSIKDNKVFWKDLQVFVNGKVVVTKNIPDGAKVR